MTVKHSPPILSAIVQKCCCDFLLANKIVRFSVRSDVVPVDPILKTESYFLLYELAFVCRRHILV